MKWCVLVLLMMLGWPLVAQDVAVSKGAYKVQKVVETVRFVSGNDLNGRNVYFYDDGVFVRMESEGGAHGRVVLPEEDRPVVGVTVKDGKRHVFDGTVDSLFDGSMLQKVSLYDADGDIVEQHRYVAELHTDGSKRAAIAYSAFYVYRKPKVLLYSEEYMFAGGRMTRRCETMYNKKGLPKMMSQYAMSENCLLSLQEHYSYDRYGQRVKRVQQFFDADGNATRTKTERYKLSYDKHGNWVEKRYYYGDQLLSTTIREITYAITE